MLFMLQETMKSTVPALRTVRDYKATSDNVCTGPLGECNLYCMSPIQMARRPTSVLRPPTTTTETENDSFKRH